MVAGATGLEPVHARVKVWCLTDLATPQCLVHLGGFEPPAHGLEVRCSIQLSYRRKYYNSIFFYGAGEGNRTLATSLEGWGSTTELHPHWWRRLDSNQ